MNLPVSLSSGRNGVTGSRDLKCKVNFRPLCPETWLAIELDGWMVEEAMHRCCLHKRSRFLFIGQILVKVFQYPSELFYDRLLPSAALCFR